MSGPSADEGVPALLHFRLRPCTQRVLLHVRSRAGPASSGSEDLERLRTALVNERFSPELLPHQDDLVKRVQDMVDEQEQRTLGLGADESQTRLIYELEKERVMFVMTSYLRIRLLKLQKLSLYLEQNEEARSNLSEDEQSFHTRYVALYRRHVQREAWDHESASALPDRVKDVASASELLAKPPDLEAHVFCVAMTECDPLVINRSGEAVVVDRMHRW